MERELSHLDELANRSVPRICTVASGMVVRRPAERSSPLSVQVRQARTVQTEGSSETQNHIEVVGAVIVDSGRVFCTQRGPGHLAGRWEFPGGKLEPGESPEAALTREIREELGCAVRVGARVVTTEHDYDFAAIVLTTFYCSLVDGEPTLSEHTSSAWLPPAELTTLNWAPADVPAVQQIQSDFA